MLNELQATKMQAGEFASMTNAINSIAEVRATKGLVKQKSGQPVTGGSAQEQGQSRQLLAGVKETPFGVAENCFTGDNRAGACTTCYTGQTHTHNAST